MSKTVAQAALREPLVHFLLGGALIFAFFVWRGEPADPASRTILVTPEVQAQVALTYERTMQRPPSDSELDRLIDQYVREEVLYREALRLGLDRDDPVVRRRLAKKMDFLATSAAETDEPSQAELEAWYNDHADRFSNGTRLSFDQVYFPNQPDPVVTRLELERDWRSVGEPSSLPAAAEDRLAADVAAQFGQVFVQRLLELSPGTQWHGPIRSGLGWHFVRLSERKPGVLPPLESQRGRVSEDWRLGTAERRRDEAYAMLREAYSVRIDR
ncbi:peptidyl-prolyl cis-trans isomerase [Qipengyuania sp. CAU 1752]